MSGRSIFGYGIFFVFLVKLCVGGGGSGSNDYLLNNCKGMEDGVYSMRLIDDDSYPIVSIKCSNGYGIIDYNLDSNINEYFSSWIQWFPQTVGPSNDEHINWNEWFLPSDDNTQYLISPDCNSCDIDHQRQIYQESTTYWMTGTIYGCQWRPHGLHNCDVSYETNKCHYCVDTSAETDVFYDVDDDTNDTSIYDATGICPHNVRDSKTEVTASHDQCIVLQTDFRHLKPSVGIEGKYCVCFQQSETQFFDAGNKAVSNNNNNKYTINKKANSNSKSDDSFTKVNNLYDPRTMDDIQGDITYLYQKDFELGTYRIKSPGIYVVMEDIEFDFNSLPDDVNNDLAYWPHSEQVTDYPGTGGYKDQYFTGFFAGITIETNDVLLDLNGHSLSMSEYFYHQQRWFTTIELSTQYFLPGQSFANFGGNPTVASNVEIKNGIIDWTSHHGIHGNYNKNIKFENLVIKNFETHGIQLNGFDNIVLDNIEIGPTSSKVYFNGEYGQERFLIRIYKQIAKELLENEELDDEDKYLQFYGRDEATTMQEIVDELELQMNMAFDYVVNDISYDDSSNVDDDTYNSFVSAKKLFINDKNDYLPNGGAQYGIFLNTFGASVFTYNLNTFFYSSTAYLTNIKIHGMRHSFKEYSRIHIDKATNVMANQFSAPLNAEELFEDVTRLSSLKEPKYKGNIILDAVMAASKFTTTWNYLLQQNLYESRLLEWAQTGDSSLAKRMYGDSTYIQLACNNDVMIHSGKGINGLRLDGVENIHIENIEVYDLYEATPLGKTICGEYSHWCKDCDSFGGHFFQKIPMQVGFSGNMNQAININAAKDVYISNANINNIESETGPAFGISIWPACNVVLDGEINISNLNGGTKLEKGLYSYNDRPNKAPEVCGVRVFYEYNNYKTYINDTNAQYNIDSDTLDGHVGCLGSDSVFDKNSYDHFKQLMDNETLTQLGTVDKTMYTYNNQKQFEEEQENSNNNDYNVRLKMSNNNNDYSDSNSPRVHVSFLKFLLLFVFCLFLLSAVIRFFDYHPIHEIKTKFYHGYQVIGSPEA